MYLTLDRISIVNALVSNKYVVKQFNDVNDPCEIYAIRLKLEYVVVYLKILGLDFF